MDKLEEVQWRATRMVRGWTTCPVEEKLIDQRCFSLEMRWLWWRGPHSSLWYLKVVCEKVEPGFSLWCRWEDKRLWT